MGKELRPRGPFADRLKKAMYLRDVSVAQLARATGIGESTIHRYLTGEREPIYGKLIEIASALKADLNFLAGMDEAGPQDMTAAFISKLASDVGARLGIQRVTEGTSDAETAAILGKLPMLGPLSEGPGMEFTDQGYPAGPCHYFIPSLGDTGRHAYALAIDDDSMAPRVQNGDLVVCSPDEDWESGDLVIVRSLRGDMVLRLIQDRDSAYLLRSYDPARDLVERSKKDVSFVHKATSIRPGAHARHMDEGYQP